MHLESVLFTFKTIAEKRMISELVQSERFLPEWRVSRDTFYFVAVDFYNQRDTTVCLNVSFTRWRGIDYRSIDRSYSRSLSLLLLIRNNVARCSLEAGCSVAVGHINALSFKILSLLGTVEADKILLHIMHVETYEKSKDDIET